MILPKGIKIGSLNYSVELKADLRDDSDQRLNGWIRENDQQIYLAEGLPLELEKVILLHEIIHGVLDCNGIREHEENLIVALSHGLMQVFSDNPVLLDYIGKKK